MPVTFPSDNLFFSLAKFSDLAKGNFKMAKSKYFLDFLITHISADYKNIARFLYWVLSMQAKMRKNLNLFNCHTLVIAKFG